MRTGKLSRFFTSTVLGPIINPVLPTDLLAGPYVPPKFKRGDRAFCLYRDCDVVVTAWTDARIPWPRCQVAGVSGGSAS